MYIKNILIKVLHLILGLQRSIKLREYVKGLYRYPRSMLGRNFNINNITNSDILIFATHPDDEILGLSATISRHSHQNEKITIVYVTDGSGRDGESWKRKKHISEQIVATRLEEGLCGLKVLNISQNNLLCLGFPDGGTHRYLKEMSYDVFSLIKKVDPKKVYVHCIEGGHNDHDLVSVVVKSVCNKLKFDNVYEWATYNHLSPLGTSNMGFLPSTYIKHERFMKIKLSESEKINKRKMLSCHISQDVEQYYTQGEIIRKSNIEYYEEELKAYSNVIKEEWGFLVKRYINYIGKTG